MTLRINFLYVILAAIVGCALGYVGGPPVVLVPWAIVGLLLGTGSKSKKAAAVNGAVYGFALAYVFMVAGYNGAEPLTTKLLPFILFGIVGAVCGVALSLIGLLVAKRQPAK